MRFWDSSAIVPLLLDEPGREALLAMLESDPVMVVWWGTPAELVSALSRRERDGNLTLAAAPSAIERIRALERAWHQVVPAAGRCRAARGAGRLGRLGTRTLTRVAIGRSPPTVQCRLCR